MYIQSGGKNICGISIGVLCLESYFPKPPGHIKNPSSLPFTVLYETVQGATVKKLLHNPNPELITPFITAAKRLEDAGVRAITGSCGFLALYQQQLAQAVHIPVFSSSLIQLPLAFQLSGAQAPVGILTASKTSLTQAHFEAVGAAHVPVVIQGMEGYQEFNDVIIEAKRNTMNLTCIEEEILDAAQSLYKSYPEIRSIVLECTDMPPVAHSIQAALQLPIYDLTTLATMVSDVVRRTPYHGFI